MLSEWHKLELGVLCVLTEMGLCRNEDAGYMLFQRGDSWYVQSVVKTA